MPLTAFGWPFAALSLLAALATGVGCVDVVAIDGPRYVEREERRFTVTGKPELTLATFDGSIEVRSWNQPDVLVVIEKRGLTKEATAEIEVKTEQDGNRISVTTRVYPERYFGIRFGSRSARLVVSVPAASDVQARTGDGSVDIEAISGRVLMRTGDGRISGRGLAGEINAHTGDGTIRLDGINGRLDAVTGDGRIEVAGMLSSVRVRSGDGSVTVHASAGSAAGDDWDIMTGDGSVSMELPDSFGGQLDAHTGDGGISMDNITLSNVTGKIGRNRVQGQLGAGGRAVRIRTGDGSITLRRH
jgi:DUF4097 and DUF4098 domain-containing protein YvlB